MIIDLILDRKDGLAYNPISFYNSCKRYEKSFGFHFSISRAMEGGVEQKVKHLLCEYIFSQGYNPEICDYVNSVNWM